MVRWPAAVRWSFAKHRLSTLLGELTALFSIFARHPAEPFLEGLAEGGGIGVTEAVGNLGNLQGRIVQ